MARTLATKAVPGEDAVFEARQASLAGPVKEGLGGWWSATKASLDASDQRERERHGGSAPTFGDPSAALAKADAMFASVFAMLDDVTEARAAITFDDVGVHARATFAPRPGDGPASREVRAMVTGDAQPLLDLPEGVLVGVLARDSGEARGRNSGDQRDAIEKIFAGRLGDADKTKIAAMLDAWAKGRGDWISAGLVAGDGRRALYVRSAVADQATLDRAVRETLGAPKLVALAEPIKQWAGELTIGDPTPLGDAPGTRVRIDHKSPATKLTGADRKREPDRFEVAWSVDAKSLALAAAADGKRALRTLADGKTLAADPDVKRALDGVGGEASFAIVVLPMRLAAALAPKSTVADLPSAPIVLALGRRDANGWLRADISAAALREAVRLSRAE